MALTATDFARRIRFLLGKAEEARLVAEEKRGLSPKRCTISTPG
jgi:hypothetical protein